MIIDVKMDIGYLEEAALCCRNGAEMIGDEEYAELLFSIATELDDLAAKMLDARSLPAEVDQLSAINGLGRTRLGRIKALRAIRPEFNLKDALDWVDENFPLCREDGEGVA